MASPRQRFAREIRAITRRQNRLERDTIRSALSLLEDLRKRISAEVTSAERFEEFRLKQLSQSVDELITQFTGQMIGQSNGAMNTAYNNGSDSVVLPLEAAGIQGRFNRPGRQQVIALTDFSADLIRNIGDDMRGKINTQIRLGVLGGTSPFRTMQAITGIMGTKAPGRVVRGVAARAETILRTEMGRVYSIANQQQMDITAEDIPGLTKRWIATGDTRTRLTHLLVHIQTAANPIPYDQPFSVGGAKLLHPHDPSGPPGETINCRCTQQVVHPDLGIVPSGLDSRVKQRAEEL